MPTETVNYTNIFALDNKVGRWMEAEIAIKVECDAADRTLTATEMFNSVASVINEYYDCGASSSASSQAIKDYLTKLKAL